jgi:hypothetical protein
MAQRFGTANVDAAGTVTWVSSGSGTYLADISLYPWVRWRCHSRKTMIGAFTSTVMPAISNGV